LRSIADNLAALRSQLPEHVTLVAVSKTKPIEMLMEAYDAGQRHFGENRPQEMREKWEAMPKDIHWHFIGHLQTNKVKYIIDFVHLIHAVDSVRLMKEIDKRAASIDRKIDCLLQVHIAQESEKFGWDSESLLTAISQGEMAKFDHITLCGLLGLAPFTDDMEVVGSEFDLLRKTFKESKELIVDRGLMFNHISMGMSGDYLTAIERGSTIVRVGSSIFGTRN